MKIPHILASIVSAYAASTISEAGTTTETGAIIETNIQEELKERLNDVCGSQQAGNIQAAQYSNQLQATLKKAIDEENLRTVACVILNVLSRKGDAGVEALNVAIDSRGTTPLMYALQKYDPTAVTDSRKAMAIWLLAAGVDTNRNNGSDGQDATALGLAQISAASPLTAALVWAAGGADLDSRAQADRLRQPDLASKVVQHRLLTLANQEVALERLLLDRAQSVLSTTLVPASSDVKIAKALEKVVRARCPQPSAWGVNLKAGLSEQGAELMREVMAGQVDGVACRLAPLVQALEDHAKTSPISGKPEDLALRFIDAQWRGGETPLRADALANFRERASRMVAQPDGPLAHPANGPSEPAGLPASTAQFTDGLQGVTALELAIEGLAFDMARAPAHPTLQKGRAMPSGVSPFRAIAQMLLAAKAATGLADASRVHALELALGGDLDLTAASVIGLGGQFPEEVATARGKLLLADEAKTGLIEAVESRIEVLQSTEPEVERLLLLRASPLVRNEANRQRKQLEKQESKLKRF